MLEHVERAPVEDSQNDWSDPASSTSAIVQQGESSGEQEYTHSGERLPVSERTVDD
jgi:hypothetical protein